MPNTTQTPKGSLVKTCRVSGQQFIVTEEDQRFYQKMEVPIPILCPEERIKLLMSFRNERILYKRKCSFSGKPIISAYHENTNFPVYDNEYWWSDEWNALDYEKKFDFSRSFFDQFNDLLQKVPQLGVSVVHSENCSFNSHVSGCKDCYLNALIIDSQDCHYCYWGAGNVDLVDCFNNTHSTLGYENIDCHYYYELIYCQECNNCSNCYFSFQLENCKNCIGCSNLQNKEYYVFNQKVTEEEFYKQKNFLINGSREKMNDGKNIFEKVKKQSIYKNLHNINAENIIGDHLRNCKNCYNCFDGMNSEDCKNCTSFNGAKDVYDCYAGAVPKGELLYNVCVGKNCYNTAFSSYVINCSNVRYSNNCHNCTECFGCCGLVGKKYCIFNKQYSKEEYEKLFFQIIEHMKKTKEWGEFFPTYASLFAYNETIAHESYPLNEPQALEKKYQWKKEEKEDFSMFDKNNKTPDILKDFSEVRCKEIFSSEITNRPYQIQLNEFHFYKKLQLPLPSKHPEERHYDRLKRRNNRKIYSRECALCSSDMITTYDSSEDAVIYCEDCYLKILQ